MISNTLFLYKPYLQYDIIQPKPLNTTITNILIGDYKMAKMITLAKPLDKEPNLCMDLDDIGIIADHYGYDYCECRVIGGIQEDEIWMVGYCLVDKDGKVVDDIKGWQKDEALIRKFYEHDLNGGFIEDISFEEYSEPYLS